MHRQVRREMVYLKRAVCLQALTKAGEEKRYSWKGVAGNVMSLSVLMVVGASLAGSELGLRGGNRPAKRAVTLQLSVSRWFGPFWGAVGGVALLYERMHRLEWAEAWYVVLYSVSAALPLLGGGKLALWWLPASRGKSQLTGCLYAVAAGLSAVFVLANSERKWKSWRSRGSAAGCCVGAQLVLVWLSVLSPEYLIELVQLKVSLPGN